jgi:hypothetical protein
MLTPIPPQTLRTFAAYEKRIAFHGSVAATIAALHQVAIDEAVENAQLANPNWRDVTGDFDGNPAVTVTETGSGYLITVSGYVTVTGVPC